MGFHPLKARLTGQFLLLDLSTPKGALHGESGKIVHKSVLDQLMCTPAGLHVHKWATLIS